MSRTWWIGMVTGAAILGVVTLGVVQSGAAKSAADLSGSWRLDASKSELPGRGGPGGFRGGRGPGGGGGWGGRGGAWGGRGGSWGGRHSGGGSPDGQQGEGERRGGMRGRRLPEIIHVTEQGGVVEIADSTGAPVQEIQVEGAASAAPSGPGDEVARLTGHWDNGTLVAERTGPGGGTMVQKFKLEDHGRTLEIHMEFKAGPNGGSGDGARRFAGREMKLVYRRNG